MSAAQAATAAPPDPAALKKKLLGLIPKDKASVFAFQINWAILDAAPPAVKDKISGKQSRGEPVQQTASCD